MSIKLTASQARKLGLAKKRKPKAAKADDHGLFLAACKAHGLPKPVPEHKFHPKRKWRFDFAWPGHYFSGYYSVALEIEGVGKGGEAGRHQRIGGWLKDMEKYNEAILLGWKLLRVTTDQVKSGEAFSLVKRALYGDRDQLK